MPQPRLQKIITELPFDKKLIAAGAVLLVLSLFLPWYQDIDSFHTGQSFTGLSGPLYLVGFSFLVMALLALTFIGMDYFNKRISFFNIKSSRMYFGFGIFSFYLLFVVNSVYFDRDFGINIAMKESQYGMFLAFIACALLTMGGYMTLRERKSILQEFEEETREPAIMIPKIQQQKPRENLRTVYPKVPQPSENLHSVYPKISQPSENLRPVYTPPQPIKIAEQKNPNEKTVEEKTAKKPQPFRMDL